MDGVCDCLTDSTGYAFAQPLEYTFEGIDQAGEVLLELAAHGSQLDI